MKLVSAMSVKGTVPLVLFANGRRDERVFRGIASRYNHRKELLSPQIPRTTGLVILRTLATLVEITATNTFIIVIDREHVESEERILRELSEYGFKARVMLRKGGLLKISCVRGPRSIILYIVLLGYTEKGNIEELSLIHI